MTKKEKIEFIFDNLDDLNKSVKSRPPIRSQISIEDGVRLLDDKTLDVVIKLIKGFQNEKTME